MGRRRRRRGGVGACRRLWSRGWPGRGAFVGGVVRAAELALVCGASAADDAACGCAIGRRRRWCRIRFPICVRRATRRRSCRRRSRRRWLQVWVTPQGGGAPSSGWIPGRTGSLITAELSAARGRILDKRIRAPRIPASGHIPADKRTRAGQRMTGTEPINLHESDRFRGIGDLTLVTDELWALRTIRQQFSSKRATHRIISDTAVIRSSQVVARERQVTA